MVATVHHLSPRYADALDFEALWAEYPTAPDYFGSSYQLSADAIRALQEQRFVGAMARAWQIPFYQRLWGQAGIDPGDIRGLDDLGKLPVFSVHDLRDSIARNPPWGDLIDLDPEHDAPMPLVLQTSGGTTGMPRPMLYAPRDREIMNIITGRRLHMQGVRPFDPVQVMLSLGLSNGGFLAREGIWKYTGAIPIMTGSGAQTSTRRQIELMLAWKTKHLIGFPSYLRHVGLVMRDDLGIDPRSAGIVSLIAHLGVENRASLEALWGAKAYDTYGTNECGSLAAECEAQTGMHVFEDAFVLELVDSATLAPVEVGVRGTILQTTLFKQLAPLIRFNSHDISAVVPGRCPCGCGHMRLERIFGRSDNMVKLKGTNVFPEAIGALVGEFGALNGEYLCVIETTAKGEEMTVFAEAADGAAVPADLADAVQRRLKEALGVTLPVEIVGRGALDARTGLSANSKIRRLIDNRDGGAG